MHAIFLFSLPGLAKSMPENKDRKRKHDKVIGGIQASQTLQTQVGTCAIFHQGRYNG